MLDPRTLAGVGGWLRHVAPPRSDLSSARIVGRSMRAIGAGGQEARLSLGLTMRCRIWYFFTVLCCCLDSESLFGYREPKDVTVFVFV